MDGPLQRWLLWHVEVKQKQDLHSWWRIPLGVRLESS